LTNTIEKGGLTHEFADRTRSWNPNEFGVSGKEFKQKKQQGRPYITMKTILLVVSVPANNLPGTYLYLLWLNLGSSLIMHNVKILFRISLRRIFLISILWMLWNLSPLLFSLY
jgi:hypothetical protein